ncbi:hypothetical protein KX928_10145 [Roseobacter sp. YSTF-M11]|uniref:Uncharacterized protein n=1 Tax=Roseobacter insulae TaxID=2859783 RepID=A0A9X1FV39_9RHOB|nr:hypothetical protein [Roseobacter insulae]MBW4708146.1 hypothetical protein [Roseobacter insulae]
MGSPSDTAVKRRKVFYIPGYDPFPPRRYRELYRKQGAAQAAISGYALSMNGGLEGDAFGWRVETMIDGHRTDAEIEVLVWSDIVQDSRVRSISLTYGYLLRTAWIYMSTGALWRLMKLRKGPVIAALYPVAMLLGQLVVALLAGWGVWQVVVRVPPALFHGAETTAAIDTLTTWGAIVIGAVLSLRVLHWFRDHDGRFFAYYLMHDFAHSAALYGAYPGDIASRLDDFGDTIAKALTTEVDEVLVVGHSSGAHMAVSILSDLIRAGQATDKTPALSLLSLGQVVPMVSFLPSAYKLRADLRYLSASDELTWVDVTAPGDGCSFALCDPVAVSGQTTPQKRWPLVFSAAFTQSLSPERWRALRWRFFRLHFQYLCAFDQPKDYDYFQITAGPQTLAARYDGRPASRSRIDHTVSKYTSLRP